MLDAKITSLQYALLHLTWFILIYVWLLCQKCNNRIYVMGEYVSGAGAGTAAVSSVGSKKN